MMEYAIARSFRQLQLKKEREGLTEEEEWLLDRTALDIAEYERRDFVRTGKAQKVKK